MRSGLYFSHSFRTSFKPLAMAASSRYTLPASPCNVVLLRSCPSMNFLHHVSPASNDCRRCRTSADRCFDSRTFFLVSKPKTLIDYRLTNRPFCPRARDHAQHEMIDLTYDLQGEGNTKGVTQSVMHCCLYCCAVCTTVCSCTQLLLYGMYCISNSSLLSEHRAADTLQQYSSEDNGLNIPVGTKYAHYSSSQL